MIVKDCPVKLNNEEVIVFIFDGIEVQAPAINREAYTVRVKFDGNRYEIVADDYEEPEAKAETKTAKKTTEHKKVQKDENEE